MSTNKNFYSLLDRPQTQASPVGKDIYEWSYLDSVGKLKTDNKNVYKEIQSYKNSVDYKRKIEEGEIFEYGNGVRLDSNKFFADDAGINQYLDWVRLNIQSKLEEQEKNKSSSNGSETTSQASTLAEESASNPSGSGAVDGAGQQGGDGK